MNNCLDCDEKVKSNIRDRDGIIKTAKEYADRDDIEYAIYKDGGEWRCIRIDIAIREGVPFDQVISKHIQLKAV